MNFEAELAVFPSEIHKNIYCYARQITPLENSLADIDDNEMKASCEDFHAFVMDMLSDMYDNPSEYSLPIGELESFLNGKKVNGMKRKYPSKTKKLISQMRNAVGQYMVLLSKLAYMGELCGDILIVPQEELEKLERTIVTTACPVSFEKRLAALSRLGFVRTEKGFASLKYPKMFSSMCALAQKAKGSMSGFAGYLFGKLDFRNLTKSYKPTHLDYFRPLTEKMQNIAFELHNIAKEYGCKDTINTFLKVEYKYKGVQVMTIDTDDNRIILRVTEVYGWDDKELFNSRLAKEPIDLQKYAIRHLWRCTGCSTSHLGQFIEVAGHRARVCGGGQIGFLWYNPTVDDIDNIRFFIKTRCDIINEMKKKK